MQAQSGQASVEPELLRVMRGMAAAMTEVERFAKAGGEAPPLAAAGQVVTLAKSLPAIFPPGSELDLLPGRYDAPATRWEDVERFLDAQRHVVLEASRLYVIVREGDGAAIGAQASVVRQACGGCHDQFRN